MSTLSQPSYIKINQAVLKKLKVYGQQGTAPYNNSSLEPWVQMS